MRNKLTKIIRRDCSEKSIWLLWICRNLSWKNLSWLTFSIRSEYLKLATLFCLAYRESNFTSLGKNTEAQWHRGTERKDQLFETRFFPNYSLGNVLFSRYSKPFAQCTILFYMSFLKPIFDIFSKINTKIKNSENLELVYGWAGNRLNWYPFFLHTYISIRVFYVVMCVHMNWSQLTAKTDLH